MKFPTYKHEQQKLAEGFTLIAGCDEVGVAPLAGPVVACAVILDPDSIGKQRSKSKWWYRVRDSKTVNEKERGELVGFIKDHCLDYGIGIVASEIIDEINIYNASLLAMYEAVNALNLRPKFLYLDGLHTLNNIKVDQQAIIDGDAKILSISAASIIAKVSRDQILANLSEMFPAYGFASHKGYPTKQHRLAINQYGVSPAHRKSFGYVKLALKRRSSPAGFKKLCLSL